MKQKIKQLAGNQVSKNFMVYGATNALASGLPLLLLPFLTDYLKPTDMAMLAMFQLFFNFLNPFIGVNGVALTSVVHPLRSTAEFRKHKSSLVWLIFISALICGLVLYPLGNFIEQHIGFSLKWVYVTLLFVTFEKFNEFLLTYWRLINKVWWFAAWRILRVLLELGLSIFIVVNIETSWQGRVNGIVLAALLVGVVSFLIILIQNKGVITFSKTDVQEILKFGVPLIPHVLSGVIINYADLLFVRNMVSEEATGLYSVGYQVGMILGLFQNSFNQAWVPWFFKKLANITNQWRTKLVKITYAYFITLLLLALLLSVLTPILFSLFIDNRFNDAQAFVSWIAFGYAINGMYKMVVNYLIFLKKTKVIATSTVVVGIINVVLNYYLIKQHGAIGAAQATTISFALEFLFIWYLSAKFFPMNWKLN